jgi:hypothetical protein
MVILMGYSCWALVAQGLLVELNLCAKEMPEYYDCFSKFVWGGGWRVQLQQRASCDPILQCLLGDVSEPPLTAVTLSSNGLGWHHIFTHWYCDHLVAAMSHHGCHTIPMLLRAIAATTIHVISPGPVATKGHSSGLPISPTLLAELGRRHVKKFHTNICFVQHRGESNPHQPGYHGLTGWFHINNKTWCKSWVFLACEVSFSTVCFLKWYMLLWSLVAMRLVMSPPACCFLDYFGAIFCHQTFCLGIIQK